MVQINFASREVNCKIVYYGPGRCGKTTNLQIVHAKAPQNSTGELVSIATETDRTLYFDFLPLDLGTVAGMRTKFQLYTVPGQVYYDATRKLVLQGCDGIVFVADSNPDIMAENIESLDNLQKNLAENGLDMMDLPLVLQYNKRDMPNAMPVAEMNEKLNRGNWPAVEAVAVNGDGVFQTLKSISQQVIRRLNREQGFAEDGSKRGKPAISAVKAPTTGVASAPPPPPAHRHRHRLQPLHLHLPLDQLHRHHRRQVGSRQPRGLRRAVRPLRHRRLQPDLWLRRRQRRPLRRRPRLWRRPHRPSMSSLFRPLGRLSQKAGRRRPTCSATA
jgi:signal recognition particle receptor subunit beta